MDKIFIQIASYRDPQLVPTIKDCLKKAKCPERLSFGICWQRECTETFEFINDPRFTTIVVPHEKSKGVCWARHAIQNAWQGEKYTLMLDSHHRFAQDWDETLIGMLASCDSKKPILSAYIPSFNPDVYDEGKEIIQDPWQMNADKFSEDGILIFIPSTIDGWQSLSKPIPSRFMSAHFIFASSDFIKEVPYDPNLYFIGEEISLAVRSWTNGWDIFHPHRCVVWHEYTRKGRPKHWDDHDKNKQNGPPWYELDGPSRHRTVRMLRGEENLGVYGLGSVRTVQEYEHWAGVEFKNKLIHPDALHYKPPGHITDMSWLTLVESAYETTISWKPEDINSADDCDFWFFGIEDKNGHQCMRKDFTLADSADILSKKKCECALNFKSYREPHQWIIWPHSVSKGWLPKHIELFDVQEQKDLIAVEKPTTEEPFPSRDMFKKAIVLTNKGRPDQLDLFYSRLDAAKWPFMRPESMLAVDGETVPTPAGWENNKLEWGRTRSYMAALEQAITNNVDCILIMEDGIKPTNDFRSLISRFVTQVPKDWDGIVLSGQQIGVTDNNVIKNCVNCVDVSCIALQRKLMTALYQGLHNSSNGVAATLGNLMFNFHVYAPAQNLFIPNE